MSSVLWPALCCVLLCPHCMSTASPLRSYYIPTASPLYSHCTPTASRVPTAFPLCSHCILTVFPLYPHCVPTASPLHVHCVPIAPPLHPHYVPTASSSLSPSLTIIHPDPETLTQCPKSSSKKVQGVGHSPSLTQSLALKGYEDKPDSPHLGSHHPGADSRGESND